MAKIYWDSERDGEVYLGAVKSIGRKIIEGIPPTSTAVNIVTKPDGSSTEEAATISDDTIFDTITFDVVGTWKLQPKLISVGGDPDFADTLIINVLPLGQ